MSSLPKTQRDGQSLFPQTRKTIYLSLGLFGFFLGVAVLAKGPAALILAGGAILLWAAFTKCWREPLRLFHPIAIATFCLTCLPWYVLCARRNPDFFRVFIIEHNFKRYLTPEFQHIQPFWYYLPITIIALLPWIFWLVWFATRAARNDGGEQQRSLILFLAGVGSVAGFIFFLIEIETSRLHPPGGVSIGLSNFAGSYARTEIAGCVGALPCWAHRRSLICVSSVDIFFEVTGARAFGVALHCCGGLGGLIIIVAALMRQTRAGLIFSVVLVLFLLNLVYVSISKLDPELSARGCARQIGVERAANTYSFKLQRSWQYQLNFYLHREIAQWSPAVGGEATVVTNEKNLQELERNAQIIAVISTIAASTRWWWSGRYSNEAAALRRDTPGGGQMGYEKRHHSIFVSAFVVIVHGDEVSEANNR